MKSKISGGANPSFTTAVRDRTRYRLFRDAGSKIEITDDVIRGLNEIGGISLRKRHAQELEHLLEESLLYFQAVEIDRLDAAAKSRLRSFKQHARKLIGLSAQSAEWTARAGRPPAYSAAVQLNSIFEDNGQSLSQIVRDLERANAGIDNLLAERSEDGRPKMETYLLDFLMDVALIYKQADGKFSIKRFLDFAWALLEMIRDGHRLGPSSKEALSVWFRDQLRKDREHERKLKLMRGSRPRSSSASSPS
jgi:hypothetical protein